MSGLVLIFNRNETEYGYPYVNVYNLVEVELDVEEMANNDVYIVLRRSTREVVIGSWEEDNDYYSRIGRKLTNLKGKYLCRNKNELYEIYDADKNEYISMEDYQEEIKHNFMSLLCNHFVLFP